MILIYYDYYIVKISWLCIIHYTHKNCIDHRYFHYVLMIIPTLFHLSNSRKITNRYGYLSVICYQNKPTTYLEEIKLRDLIVIWVYVFKARGYRGFYISNKCLSNYLVKLSTIFKTFCVVVQTLSDRIGKCSE